MELLGNVIWNKIFHLESQTITNFYNSSLQIQNMVFIF